ncbi:MAG: ATP-binding protein [Nitrososphaerales archaeon]
MRKLEDAIESKMFAAVTGPRRVGKTSVLKTCIRESKFKFILFDLSPYIDRTSVSYRALTPTEIGFEDTKISAEARANLAIFTLTLKKESVIGADVFESSIISLLRELNNRFDHFAFVVDEAQVMSFMKGLNPSGLLQLIHNNYENVSVVLTGSMLGMILKMLHPTDSSEAAFARYVETLNVPRWSDEESAGFLERGLELAPRSYK